MRLRHIALLEYEMGDKGTSVSGKNRRAGPGGIRAALCVTVLACTLLFAGGLGGKVAAQTASFRSVDTNGDRVLSFDELVAAFGEAGARALLRDVDRNRDNRITIIELRGGRDHGRDAREDRGERDRGDDRGNSGGRGNGGSDDRDDNRGDDRGDDRDDDD